MQCGLGGQSSRLIFFGDLQKRGYELFLDFSEIGSSFFFSSKSGSFLAFFSSLSSSFSLHNSRQVLGSGWFISCLFFLV